MNGPQLPYRKLAPGIYQDAEGQGVINLAELLEMYEVEDTPENRQIAGGLALSLIREAGMRAAFRAPGDPEWCMLE